MGLKENKAIGKVGETIAEIELNLMGYNVSRTPKGKDFTVKHPFLGNKEIMVEVKTGRNPKLSDLQKKTQAKNKKNYHIYRIRA